MEHLNEVIQRLKITKIFLSSLVLIFGFAFSLSYFAFWRFSETTSVRGIAMISADYLGTTLAHLIWAFLLVWTYRIYSYIRKKYSFYTELSLLIIGSLFSIFSAFGNGYFEIFTYLIRSLNLNS